MELPFAVESPDRSVRSTLNQSNASSLVTASSQGSSLLSEGGDASLSHGAAYPPQRVSPSRYHGTMVHQQQPISPDTHNAETIDFTYVTVCEEDANEVDVVIDEVLSSDSNHHHCEDVNERGDVLALLLSSSTEEFVLQCEQACEAAQDASNAKDRGDLSRALDAHTQAAKTFRAAATDIREENASLANSLLMLSQSQARSALALKRILKHRPTTRTSNSTNTHKDRLLATVRGALVTKKEADISDSAFLGRATGGPSSERQEQKSPFNEEETVVQETPTLSPEGTITNPVDDMMELEKELRDMDMALELGNSIASLGGRNRMKHSAMEEGSFCVVPPGSASYMSSSTLWASPAANVRPPPQAGGTAGVRARANRVQTVSPHRAPPPALPPSPTVAKPHAPGLESSWWGHSSTTTTASQVLASSIMGGRDHGGAHHGAQQVQQQPADTKQLMRFLDSLKTLGDENAALLREVEEAEAARQEARAAREQMKRFKADYGKRFEALKAALEKFRKRYPENNGAIVEEPNPVTNSDFVRMASVSEELEKKDQLIRQLTADLKKARDESKKKDAALRKYESFYREVKARSAQKAAQRQKEAQRQRFNAPRVPR